MGVVIFLILELVAGRGFLVEKVRTDLDVGPLKIRSSWDTPTDKKFYTTDAFTDYAIERLDEYKGEDKPFLLYLPYTAPHYPLHAWPEDIAKYRGKYKIGWDQIRSQALNDEKNGNHWTQS